MTQPKPPVRIPPDQLSRDTLHTLIKEFVTRDGTELTDADAKIGQVMELLRRGEVEIWFDQDTRTCNILPKGCG